MPNTYMTKFGWHCRETSPSTRLQKIHETTLTDDYRLYKKSSDVSEDDMDSWFEVEQFLDEELRKTG